MYIYTELYEGTIWTNDCYFSYTGIIISLCQIDMPSIMSIQLIRALHCIYIEGGQTCFAGDIIQNKFRLAYFIHTSIAAYLNHTSMFE